MKKTIIIWLLLVALSPAAYAIIPGIPGLEDPIEGEIEIKFSEDRNWERPGDPPEVSTVSTYFIKPTFEVTEGLDVFLKFGVTDIDLLVANGLLDSAFGAGMRYTMSINGLGLPDLGIMPKIGETLEVRVGLEYTSLRGSAFPQRGHDGGTIRIAGWNLSLSVGGDMGMLAPYVGIRYSDETLTWNDFDKPAISYDNADDFGIFIGANIPRGDLPDTNIELGFLDGTSLKMGINFAF